MRESLLIPAAPPPNVPPIRPAATAVSMYPSTASSLSSSNPACARSINVCPSSVGTSTAAPVPAPLVTRVNNPPARMAFCVGNSRPTINRSAKASRAACGNEFRNAALSLISTRSPCCIASFCASRLLP